MVNDGFKKWLMRTGQIPKTERVGMKFSKSISALDTAALRSLLDNTLDGMLRCDLLSSSFSWAEAEHSNNSMRNTDWSHLVDTFGGFRNWDTLNISEIIERNRKVKNDRALLHKRALLYLKGCIDSNVFISRGQKWDYQSIVT